MAPLKHGPVSLWQMVAFYERPTNQACEQAQHNADEEMPIRPEMLARYPKDWKLRSRFVRFYRARNRCEWCGAENYQPHPITGSKVVLTTAHVWDMRPEACSLLNLAALCQRCHNRWDAPYRKRNRARRNGQMEMVL